MVKREMGAALRSGALIAAVLWGCGAAEPGRTGPLQDGPAAAQPTLLWSEELEAGHRLSFYELATGDQALLEDGLWGTATRVEPAALTAGFGPAWARLHPGAALPQALRESDLRRAQAGPVAPAQTLATPGAGAGGAPGALVPRGLHGGGLASSAYTWESDWLMSSFCNTWQQYTHLRCFQGWDWADSGVTEQAGLDWQAFANQGAEGSAAAPFNADFYACSQNFWGSWSCGWQRAFTDSVQPGHYRVWTCHVNNASWAQYHAWINQAGGNTTVALVLKWSNYVPLRVPPSTD